MGIIKYNKIILEKVLKSGIVIICLLVFYNYIIGGIVMGKILYIDEYVKGDVGMTDVFEVSKYFLSVLPMTHKKLQKMCYYAYAWYYTLYGKKLFDNGRFEAWIHGPVNRELYSKYKDYGWRNIVEEDKNCNIESDIKEFLNIIIDTFGVYDANELESMTHAEKPWKKAREGYEPYQNCEVKIDDAIIKDYYTSLMKEKQGE